MNIILRPYCRYVKLDRGRLYVGAHVFTKIPDMAPVGVATTSPWIAESKASLYDKWSMQFYDSNGATLMFPFGNGRARSGVVQHVHTETTDATPL